MIIFAPFMPRIDEVISSYGRHPLIFNLSSYNSDYATLTSLNPNPEEMGTNEYLLDFDSMEFDMAYMHFIIDKSQSAFSEFFSIISAVFVDPEVCIVLLVSESPYRNALKESLAKIIQQRYGYSCNTINTPTDLVDILEQDEEPSFSILGLTMYEQDRGKWYADIIPGMPEAILNV